MRDGSVEVLAERTVEPVEIVRRVDAVDTARSGAGLVQAVRRHPTDDVRAPDEVRATRVTEAGAAAVRVVRQQDREVTGELCVDLQDVRRRVHTDPLRGLEERRSVREALLEAVADGRV